MDKKNKLAKLVIIDNSPALTGAFKSSIHFSKELRNQFAFTYLVPKNTSTKDCLKQEGFEATGLNMIEISRNFKSLLYLPVLFYNAFKLLRYIKKCHINILHINDLYNMLGVLVKVFKPKITLVYHVRLLPNSYVKKLYSIWKRLIIKYADSIICVSEAVAKDFTVNQATVIYDSFKPSPTPTQKKKSEKSDFTILCLANYIPGKGHQQAIDAFAQIADKIKPAKLVFHGGTLGNSQNQVFKENIIHYAKEIGLKSKITFNGFSANPEKEICDADLILNFSESESFSMTTLEALTYGTPIIATNCGGPQEIIENGISGILVPVNDITAMANAIAQLRNDKSLRYRLAQNGIERAKTKFNLTNQANKLADIYCRLLNKDGAD